MLSFFRDRRGNAGIDVAIIAFVLMLFIALAIKVVPAYMLKGRLDQFANELMREAEIAGRVGNETTDRANALKAQFGIDPNIVWSKTGKIQLNTEVSVTVTSTYDIGFFTFGSFPVTLKASAIGKSEVYWKTP